ncbi:hypothetical protein BDW22DRAFT_1349031 [Trametopsis cervina]|nr:hypothetical protein BDW22DRAFT_1349031 [Trametopsis cervina]
MCKQARYCLGSTAALDVGLVTSLFEKTGLHRSPSAPFLSGGVTPQTASEKASRSSQNCTEKFNHLYTYELCDDPYAHTHGRHFESYFGVPMYVTPGRERRRCSGVRRWKQRCGPLYPSPPLQADSLRHTTTERPRSQEHEPIHTKTKQIPKLPPSDLVASRHGARLARCCASATKPRIMDPSNKAPPDQIFQKVRAKHNDGAPDVIAFKRCLMVVIHADSALHSGGLQQISLAIVNPSRRGAMLLGMAA